MFDRAFLNRFLACDAPDDLRAWVVTLVFGAMSPSERREERDRWFRAAASLVPGAPWTRARRLRAIACELSRALPSKPDTSSVRGCVAMAMLTCPGRVPSLKTLGRIVDNMESPCPRTPCP